MKLLVSLENQLCWMVFCWGKHVKECFLKQTEVCGKSLYPALLQDSAGRKYLVLVNNFDTRAVGKQL